MRCAKPRRRASVSQTRVDATTPSTKWCFKKTIALQPRVVKQNRGFAGEGIWIVKPNSGNYCKNYGDKLAGDAEVLGLMEANNAQ